MKKLLFCLSILSLFAFTSEIPPIDCNVYNGYRVEAANTSDTEIQFCDIVPGQQRLIMVEMLSTNSDSIAFAVGTTVTSSYAKYGPGQKAVFTITNGSKNLHYKCDVADDEFKVSH